MSSWVHASLDEDADLFEELGVDMQACNAGAEEEQQVDEVPSGTEQLVAIAPVDEPPWPPPSGSPAVAGKAPGPPRRKRRAEPESSAPASSSGIRRVLKRKASGGKPPELQCMNRLCIWGKHQGPGCHPPLAEKGRPALHPSP